MRKVCRVAIPLLAVVLGSSHASGDSLTRLFELDKPGATWDELAARINTLWNDAERNPVICVELVRWIEASDTQAGSSIGESIEELLDDTTHPCRRRLLEAIAVADEPSTAVLFLSLTKGELEQSSESVRRILSRGKPELAGTLAFAIGVARVEQYREDVAKAALRMNSWSRDEVVVFGGHRELWGYVYAYSLLRLSANTEDEGYSDAYRNAIKLLREWVGRVSVEDCRSVCEEVLAMFAAQAEPSVAAPSD